MDDEKPKTINPLLRFSAPLTGDPTIDAALAEIDIDDPLYKALLSRNEGLSDFQNAMLKTGLLIRDSEELRPMRDFIVASLGGRRNAFHDEIEGMTKGNTSRRFDNERDFQCWVCAFVIFGILTEVCGYSDAAAYKLAGSVAGIPHETMKTRHAKRSREGLMGDFDKTPIGTDVKEYLHSIDWSTSPSHNEIVQQLNAALGFFEVEGNFV